MGARDYSELACWQLAEQAKRIVLPFTDNRCFDEYRWLRDQLRKSSSSAPANIAEGFTRFRPKDFARFLRIARASMSETLVHLKTALEIGLISDRAQLAECESLLRRARAATARLIIYLESSTE